MREPTVVRKRENRTVESSQDIQVRCFRSQRHRRGRERSSAIESGASHARAGKKMRDRLQVPPVLPVEVS